MSKGWSGLSLEKTKAAIEQEQVDEEDLRALRQQAKVFLEHPAVKQFLLNHALGRSYVAGRNFEQTAFAEGERNMAMKLLILGGEASE